MTSETDIPSKGREALAHLPNQATDFARQQPLSAMAGFIVAGVIAGKLLKGGGEEPCNGDLVMEFFETSSSFGGFLRASTPE
jgi:hypothetical protein